METAEKLNFLSTLLPLVGIVFVIAIGVVLLNQQFHKNLYRQKLEQERIKNVHQLDLLRSSITVQEEERKRIASDLHDELGAAMSIARMHLVQLEEQEGLSENWKNSLKNIRGLTETALANIRRISHELMPPRLEMFGLISTLEDVADQVNRTGAIHVKINSTSDFVNLSWQINLGLYRMHLELINNSIKHSGASNIDIVLTEHKDFIESHYSDNGKGLDENKTGGGLGLKNLEGRARSLGGTFEVGTAKSGGCFAYIRIPLLT